MTHATGYAALSAESPMAPFTFERRALRADDVRLDIRYCGVCHSDLHQARDDWHNSVYPCVPGHEIIGTVTDARVYSYAASTVSSKTPASPAATNRMWSVWT